MFSQKKPFSAVTVAIEDLTSESYAEDDVSGLPELVESIKLQATGPSEAARAIRKKLKYGDVHRQIRALVLLDGLIQNAGQRFQTSFSDEMLLERLRVCGTSELSHPKVREKCTELFRGWAVAYAGTPGMERISKLYRELPRRKQVATREKSRAVQESENPFQDDEDEDAAPNSPPAAAGPSSLPKPYGGEIPKVQSFSHVRSGSGSFFGGGGGGDSSSSRKKDKDKKKKKKDRRPFNLEEEKPKIKVTIADGNIAWSNLMNTVLSTNRERMRISENEDAMKRFEECKKIRRKVLRYIHQVMDEQLLGTLLQLNDDLVKALMTFEQLDRSIDADSDSDDELAEQAHLYRMAQIKGKEAQSSNPSSPTTAMAGLSISRSPPPRPTPPPRPSAATKPSLAAAAASSPASAPQLAMPQRRTTRTYYSDEESEEDDDEVDDDDPFADKNAVRAA